MIAKELRELSPEQLDSKLQELRRELFHLRFQLAIKQLDNPHKITAVKRDIARVLTVINEGKKNAAEKNA